MKASATTPLSEAENDPLPRERAVTMAETLRALGNPVRIRIVDLLCVGEYHVGAISERLEVSQPIVSQQLRILRMSGLVEALREGGFVRYRLARPQLRSLMRCLHRCCEESL